MNKLTWSFFNIWNNSLISRTEKPLTARDYIWASELGGAYIDRFLKMKATPYSNPPNARSLRKFQAGNIWERIIAFVLLRAGVLLDTQERLEFQYPGLLKVTGYLDMMAGGKPDWEKARASVQTGEMAILLGEDLQRATLNIIYHLESKYGQELKKIIIEVKSVSSFMFDRYEATGLANPHHKLQLFHYLKAKGMDEGHIIYICKDDCRMIEIGVFNSTETITEVEEMYRFDIEKMTNYIRNNQQPEKEPEIVFDEEVGKFQKNWKVEYSPYLKLVYGYSEPEAYRAMWDSKVGQFNRVLTRIVTKQKMTDNNNKVIEEIKAYFPDFDRIVGIAESLAQKGAELEAPQEPTEEEIIVSPNGGMGV